MKKDKDLYSEYQKFIEVSNRVFKKFINSEMAFSPLLNIVKPIPEILNKKRWIISTVANQKYFAYNLLFIPRAILFLGVSLIHHLYHLQSLYRFNSLVLPTTNFIFLSHYIGQNLANSEDLYFGSLSNENDNVKKHGITVYINHTKTRSNFDFPYLKSSQQVCSKMVLPKTVSTKDWLIIYKNNLKNFMKIIYVFVFKRGLQKNERIMLKELALQQLSMEALVQTYLLKNLVRVLKKTGAQNLLLTFEGHSYEGYVAKKVREEFSEINIGVYQFAPVVPAQATFFRNLDQLNESIKIYVSGSLVKSAILTRTQVSPNRIYILGSRKNRENHEFLSRKKSVAFLLAAEGSKNALSEFIDLGFNLALEYPKIFFIVRAHPASDAYKSKFFMKTERELPNLILSENSLEQDMREASYCIYRSSSVGLEGLAYGVVPIHFAAGQNFGLDPIELINLPHRQFEKSHELKQEILSIYQNHNCEDEKLFNNYLDIFNNYFSPLNFDSLYK